MTGTIGYDEGDWRDGQDEFYFDHGASKFKINIASIKIDNSDQWGDLIYLTN